MTSKEISLNIEENNTPKDNRDEYHRVFKGRNPYWDERHCFRSDAIETRDMLIKVGETLTILGKKFGISPSTISCVAGGVGGLKPLEKYNGRSTTEYVVDSLRKELTEFDYSRKESIEENNNPKDNRDKYHDTVGGRIPYWDERFCFEPDAYEARKIIIKLRQKGKKFEDLSKKLKVSPSTISRVVRGVGGLKLMPKYDGKSTTEYVINSLRKELINGIEQ